MKEAFKEPIEGNEDYLNITVKDVYDTLTPIKYPMITIEEIENTENEGYTDNNGEHISDLSYQIECFSRDTKTLQAPKSAELIGFKVNSILGGEKYKMRRVGVDSSRPLNEDRNTFRYILRYSCSFDLDKDVIYAPS